MSRAVNIPLMQWNPTVELRWLRAGFGIRIIICSLHLTWDALPGMICQLLHLSPIYLDDQLIVTEEANLGFQT